MKGDITEGIVAAAYRRLGVEPGSRVAVAFSGGPDSVALLALTLKAGYHAVALHCNFHLRGDESLRDEHFARLTAERLGCEIVVEEFDTMALMERGESTEMTCRRLRYDFFAEYLATHPDIKYLAVGHHGDDRAETLLLNLLRGSGTKGLAGMPASRPLSAGAPGVSATLVRPMLHLTRSAITEYLSEQGLDYVTDSSNLTTEYRRNYLRHEVMPLLQSRFPATTSSMCLTADNCRRDMQLLEMMADAVASDCEAPDGTLSLADLEKSLRRRLSPTGATAAPMSDEIMATALYHILGSRPYSISYHTATTIIRHRRESGLRFATHNRDTVVHLSFDRLLFEKAAAPGQLPEVELDLDAIASGSALALGNGVTVTMQTTGPEEFAPDRSGRTLWLDLDALRGEYRRLRWRPWREGDRLEPFGLHGSKLVSDLLTEAKIPAHRRKETWLLVAPDDEILWVAGVRASRHYAITPRTTNILKLTLNP